MSEEKPTIGDNERDGLLEFLKEVSVPKYLGFLGFLAIIIVTGFVTTGLVTCYMLYCNHEAVMELRETRQLLQHKLDLESSK